MIIHPGAIIGSDGFGLVMHAKHWKKVSQIGNVIIEDGAKIFASILCDNVKIKKGACISRGSIVSFGVVFDESVTIKFGKFTCFNCR